MLLTAMAMFAPSCAGPPARPARITHVVLIKLRDPGRAADLMRESETALTPIPGVRSYHAGTHLEIGRPNIDQDYDVALSIGFDSEADYRAYLEHPLHVGLVESWRPHWTDVRIFDAIDPEP